MDPRYTHGNEHTFPFTVMIEDEDDGFADKVLPPGTAAHSSHVPISVLQLLLPLKLKQSLIDSPLYVVGNTHCFPDTVIRPPLDDAGAAAVHSSHRPIEVLHLDVPLISVQSVSVSPRYVAGKTHCLPDTVIRPPVDDGGGAGAVGGGTAVPAGAHFSHNPISFLHFDTPPISVQSVSVSPRYVVGKTHCLPDSVTRLPPADAAHSSQIPNDVLHFDTPPMSVQVMYVSPR
jgi:hypothetical protein